MGRLAHPNIVPVLSARFEESVGLTAVCMPYLGAATLTDVIDRAYPTLDAPPPREAAVIREAIRSAACSDDPPPLAGRSPRTATGRRLLSGRRGPHRLADRRRAGPPPQGGVVHLDLKPSNVLLRMDGHALLLDFNLSADACSRPARRRHPAVHGARAAAGVPRQGAGRRRGRAPGPVALGVMLYELLTGRHPFGAAPAGQPSDEAARRRCCNASRRDAPRCCAPQPVVDHDFARLITSCLAWRRPAAGVRGRSGGRPATLPRFAGAAAPLGRPPAVGRGGGGGSAAAGGRRSGERTGGAAAACRRARVQPRPGRLPRRRLRPR